MRIDRYISNSRIIDLSSRDLKSAYSELLDTFGTQLATSASRKKVLKELVVREKSLTSYIGEGVALPHARVSMKRPYALAVGRCPAGLAALPLTRELYPGDAERDAANAAAVIWTRPSSEL